MVKKQIIIADAEAGVRQLIKIFLGRHHYEVIEAKNGQELLSILASIKADLIILDLMLPDIHGLELCKKIRESSNIPIVILTAVHGEMNTVLGFSAGADDYIEKPFSPHVLLSRIKAILRRCGNTETKPIISPQKNPETAHRYEKAVFAQWTYYPHESYVSHQNGKQIFLSKNECALLELFLTCEQEILSREKIAHALRIDIDDPESRAIDVQISRLRNKLKDRAHFNLIKSIRNKGYLLSVPVKFL